MSVRKKVKCIKSNNLRFVTISTAKATSLCRGLHEGQRSAKLRTRLGGGGVVTDFLLTNTTLETVFQV